MDIKLMIKNLKNYIKASVKNAAFLELFDVNNQSVIFEIQDINDLKEGVMASPDGEFLFTDGMKVVIENGVVVSIEKPAEEPMVEPAPANEEPVVEPAEEPVPEINKDEKIAELEAKVAELLAQIEQLTKVAEEKEEEIKSVEEDLKEIQNFYVALNKSKINARNEHKNEEGFFFGGKKN